MRKLERTYSGTERIVARARFSAWAFLREVFIAALLGGIIAVLWVFAGDIEGALDPNFSGEPRYLTPEVFKWTMVGAGGFVILLALLHALSLYMQEIIITEDRWRSEGDCIRRRLLAHMGIFTHVFARNCEVRKLHKGEAADFMNRWHSYGDATCRYRLGLFLKKPARGANGELQPGEMVAAATFLMILGARKDEEETKERNTAASPRKKTLGSIRGLVWAIGLVIYFLTSFLLGAWHITWLIFPIVFAINNLIEAIWDLKEEA